MRVQGQSNFFKSLSSLQVPSVASPLTEKSSLPLCVWEKDLLDLPFRLARPAIVSAILQRFKDGNPLSDSDAV